MVRLIGPPAADLLQDYTANSDTFLRRLRNRHPLEYARLIREIAPGEAELDGQQTLVQWARAARAEEAEQAERMIDAEADPEAPPLIR